MATLSLTRDQELLSRALQDLHTSASKNDINQTAIDMNLNTETVRRYLRGVINDWGTAKKIHDHLRKITVARMSAELDVLTTKE